MYTDKEHRGPFEFSDEIGNIPITPQASSDIVPQQFEANDKDLLLSTDEKDDNRGLSTTGSAYTAPSYDNSNISSQMQELAISGPATPATTQQSSFDFDDIFGLGLSTAPAPALTPSPPLLKLNPRAALDPGAFQQKWRQLPISLTQVCFSPQLSPCDPIHEAIVYIFFMFFLSCSSYSAYHYVVGDFDWWEIATLFSFAGLFCESPGNCGLDSSTITYQTYAESFHPLYRIGWAISKLQVFLLCSKGIRTVIKLSDRVCHKLFISQGTDKSESGRAEYVSGIRNRIWNSLVRVWHAVKSSWPLVYQYHQIEFAGWISLRLVVKCDNTVIWVLYSRSP